MKRFSILSLLLFLTIIAMSAAWWRQTSEHPEIFYLHIYSTAYRSLHDKFHPDSDDPLPDNVNTRIATLAFTSGNSFFCDVPNDTFPSVTVQGVAVERGFYFKCKMIIEIDDAGKSFVYQHSDSVRIDSFVKFKDDLLGKYHFAISRQLNPYRIEDLPK